MQPVTFQRPILSTLISRLREKRAFILVIAGPRQVGKTTLARQALEQIDRPGHYASADTLLGQDASWIESQWEIGRDLATTPRKRDTVLVLDEIQKVTNWSEIVKRLWDADTIAGHRLKVVLLGSAPLLVQSGLSESLAGRFELIRVSHWSLKEMKEAFGFDLDHYFFFGGYPGAAGLVGDHQRWASYILDSLVETTLSRDILLHARIEKPALLRQLFHMACDYSGQILSFTKMIGQLQDAGNTVTVAHYLQLLSGAGLVTGLQKYSGSAVRRRGSIPKLLALNTGLMAAVSGLSLKEAQRDRGFWGRLVETSIGAHIFNSVGSNGEVSYWRDRNEQVDFVLRVGRKLAAIEVKSGRASSYHSGFSSFIEMHGPARQVIVGEQSTSPQTFLETDISHWTKR